MKEITWVDVDKCHPNSYNPNVMNVEKFEALCDFLRSHGAEELDPIWVRNDGADGFEIVDGEHRWKAAKTVGWKRLRAFVLDVDEDDAKAFNVRKNRERGQIDAIKFGKILFEQHQAGATLEQLAKKYGYSDLRRITEYIEAFKRREDIFRIVGDASPIGIYKASKILRELKLQEKGEKEQIEEDDEKLAEAGSIETFARNYAEALQKIPDSPKDDKVVRERFLTLFKEFLEKNQIACPICGERKLVWRCGHDF